jgi:hypothetical protein
MSIKSLESKALAQHDPPLSPSRSNYSDRDDVSDSYSEYSASAYSYAASEQPLPRPSLGKWLADGADSVSNFLREIEFGPPVLYTPRDGPVGRHRPGARGPIAAIPWKELVGLKENLLSHMEGAATAEERLEERMLGSGEHAEVLRRTAAELDAAIAELEAVAESDREETEAIAADLRAQIEQLRSELTQASVEQKAVEAAAAEKRKAELEKTSDKGLMGQAATAQELKLSAARQRHQEAQARLAVHTSILSREVREVEAPPAATAALAAAPDAAAEAALASTLEKIEGQFTHRRAPPAVEPKALISRWKRLQLGEPFGLGLGGRQLDGKPQRVWVALSVGVRSLEIGSSKGSPPESIVHLAEVVHMDSDSRTMTLVTLRGERIVLTASDATMLVFWFLGVQELASVPKGERRSRGALLWRAAKHLYRAQRKK